MASSDTFTDIAITGTDFGKAASEYGTFRAGFPESLFDRLSAYDIGVRDQRLVDVGTGTGSLARGFAHRGCDVIGIDPDARMLSQARKLDASHNVSVKYIVGTAEQTGLADSSTDVLTAGQCWHWFDQPRAIAEALRILTLAGKLVVCHFDWLPFSDNVVAATEALIEKHNHRWNFDGRVGLYPQWLPGLTPLCQHH